MRRERPILFSAPMVRALLDGSKTQTRRVVRYAPVVGEPAAWCAAAAAQEPGWVHIVGDYRRFCPHGTPGTRLWVRETWDFREWSDADSVGRVRIAFAADGKQVSRKAPSDWNPTIYNYERWRPSIYMPRWASRITLEITDVRVERLNDISEEDAKAEGVKPGDVGVGYIPAATAAPYSYAFAALWDQINGKRAPWASKPWVWVISFRRVEQ